MLVASGQIGWIDATLPFWPLLAAIAVGATLATGLGRRRAHVLVVAGVAISAALALHIFGTLDRPSISSNLRGIGGSGFGPQTDDKYEWYPIETFQQSHVGRNPAVEPNPKSKIQNPKSTTLSSWLSLGNSQSVDLNFFIDPLTAVMLVTVTFVSLMVVIYAVGYMRDHHGHPERGYERFFAFLGLFVFSMCMLVLAGNFVVLYLGWELVGLCSYLLIGFYYKKPEAAAAAKKAFLVNRIGDFGFALGIFCLYMFLRGHVQPGENPLDYTTVFKYAPALSGMTVGGMSAATVVSLLLLCGAVGKSAQFPLYVWLPDAMEGPTPVSALIHAATMVTAGIYMIARCGPIFMQSQAALDVILIIGLIGAVMAATMAMAQYDMKRILAYSTISQLAFMFAALGCGANSSAVFHLFTHAFFKALLFLCAGSVMHAMGGVIDLRQFSGLRRVLPRTYILTLIGCLALAGFPLMSGFWSKDEIVHAAFARSPAAGILLLATAALTAYYTFRMFFLCFHGPTRLPAEAGEHPHDSPPVMIAPLCVLAIGAVVCGFFGVNLGFGLDAYLGFLRPHGFFHHYLEGSTIVEHAHEGAESGGAGLMYLASAIALGGIGLAWLRYGTAPQRDPDREAFGSLWNLWHAKYYVDETYDRIFVQPLRRLAVAFFTIDREGIDGLVAFVAAIPRALGAGLRLFQQGSIQAYGLSMVVGILLLVLWWLGAA